MFEKNKNLILKKAYFSDGFNGTIEQVVNGIVKELPNHADRVYNPDLFKSHILAEVIPVSGNKGLFVRIYEYEKGATGLIDLETSPAAAGIEEFHAPDKRHFLGEEIVLYIRNNHILACGLGNRDYLVQNIIGTLGIKAKAIDPSLKMKISDVPNKNELQRAAEIGVKKIDLSIDGYLASVAEITHKSLPAKIIEKVFAVPDTAEGVRKRANTHGRIILSRSKFKKEEIKKDEWLTSVGQTIIESDNTEYTMILEDNSKISTSKLKVTKPVKLKKFANSISLDEAKAALMQFYDDLQGNGSLEW